MTVPSVKFLCGWGAHLIIIKVSFSCNTNSHLINRSVTHSQSSTRENDRRNQAVKDCVVKICIYMVPRKSKRLELLLNITVLLYFSTVFIFCQICYNSFVSPVVLTKQENIAQKKKIFSINKI